MELISFTATAKTEIEARCAATPGLVPTLTWGTSTTASGKKHSEWVFIFFPRANVEDGIRIVDGVEMVVSEVALTERNVSRLRVDFMDGRFAFDEGGV